MNENNKTLPDRYRKFNYIVFAATYILSTSFLFFVIEDLKNNIILIFVVILFISPFFSLMILLIMLRFEHFAISKDIFNLLNPAKGTISNPNIDKIIGGKGVKALNILVVVLLILLIFTFAWEIYNSI